MSAYVLHEGATVQCIHSGKATPMLTDQRVKVSGQKVVTQLSIYKILGNIPRCTLPPQAGGPCATAQWTSPAQRVKASGKPVLFKDSQATCAPTGAGVSIIATQRRVKVT